MLHHRQRGNANRDLFCNLRWRLRSDLCVMAHAQPRLCRTTLHGKARHQRKQREQQPDHRRAI